MSKQKQGKIKKARKPLQWIIISPDDVMDTQMGGSPCFIKLKHPKTAEGVQFLLSSDGKRICEVMKFKEEPRSWFIEDTVQQDGGFLLATPIDPLFLIIPYLTKYSQKFRTLDQILMDDSYPSIQRVSLCVSAEDMTNVCDMKGDDDLQVFRINEEKLLAWLQRKVDITADRLALNKVHVSKGSQSATFVRSRKHSDVTREDYVRYGYGLVSDYINSIWSEKLKTALGIKEESKSIVGEGEPPAKKVRLTTEIPQAVEDYTKDFDMSKHKAEQEKSTKKMTVAQRSLAKVDKKGMKSISSFFGGGAGAKSKGKK